MTGTSPTSGLRARVLPDTLPASHAMDLHEQLRRRVRLLTYLMIFALVISGATAIPLQWEQELLVRWFGVESERPIQELSGLPGWLQRVWIGVRDTDDAYPFIAYGTDWLAFAHVVIAIAFFGALRDPVRNRWLFQFGMIACVLVVPWALVFGHVRGIPLGWRLIDCSFGVFGFLPLWLANKYTNQLESLAGKRSTC